MWIVSGDPDLLGIAVMSANLHWRMLKLQPKLAELRMIDGDPKGMTYRGALPAALLDIDRPCAKAP